MSGGARAAGEDGVRPRRAEHAARSGGVLVGRAAGARRPSRAFRFDALMARRGFEVSISRLPCSGDCTPRSALCLPRSALSRPPS
ncbi:hypothetical protein [Burkholderia pseudomallei]|uniref:hypothetical protein n=1 Tax=Burkholderia pseudomallei TaxID=28450 RepID=UPI00336C2362